MRGKTRASWIGFTANWMKRWREFCQPIMLRNDAKPITFRRLNENRSIVSVSVIVCVHNDVFCKLLFEILSRWCLIFIFPQFNLLSLSGKAT